MESTKGVVQSLRDREINESIGLISGGFYQLADQWDPTNLAASDGLVGVVGFPRGLPRQNENNYRRCSRSRAKIKCTCRKCKTERQFHVQKLWQKRSYSQRLQSRFNLLLLQDEGPPPIRLPGEEAEGARHLHGVNPERCRRQQRSRRSLSHSKR